MSKSDEMKKDPRYKEVTDIEAQIDALTAKKDAIYDSIEGKTLNDMAESIMDKWIKIPNSDDYELNKELIKTQASQYINIIDKIEELTDRLLTKRQCMILREEVVKLNDEIIQGRRDAIAEAGEYAPGNIVFKVLRRSGHIGKLKEIKAYLFDKINTI